MFLCCSQLHVIDLSWPECKAELWSYPRHLGRYGSSQLVATWNSSLLESNGTVPQCTRFENETCILGKNSNLVVTTDYTFFLLMVQLLQEIFHPQRFFACFSSNYVLGLCC